MSRSRAVPPVRIAIDRSVAPSLPEVRYALRTLLCTAGLPTDIVWDEEGITPDVYYGPRGDSGARVTIPSVPWDFASAEERTPTGIRAGVPTTDGPLPGEMVFSGGPEALTRAARGRVVFGTDIVFASHWLLTGAWERGLPRDRWDNLQVIDSPMVRFDLLERPLVSEYAEVLRRVLDPSEDRAFEWPWAEDGAGCACAFTHDVDYPEILRWIEVPRALVAGRGVGLATAVARGRSHFWQFREWIDFEAEFGARPTFYFMARKGSLVEYAMGTPDAFYDVHTPRFQRLFDELREAGCEVGLHASYHAHKSADTLRAELESIDRAAGGGVVGNRHHYWHLDPDDPNETLRRHGVAGFAYDSSLALEMYPGFRRGIAHPFRPFHPGERAPVACVQIPPAWMDDHFDRRLEYSGIADPDATARRILDAARNTRGVLVLDYHPRGMNADFFPRYGPWLKRFAQENLRSGVSFHTPQEICDAFVDREARLAALSVDRTLETSS